MMRPHCFLKFMPIFCVTLLVLTPNFTDSVLHAAEPELQRSEPTMPLTSGPPPLELKTSSGLLIEGQQRFSGDTLEFSGSVSSENSSIYLIDLRIGSKHWLTTISIEADDQASLSVTSSGAVITDSNKQLLSFTAEQLNAHAYATQDDTLLLRLLTQMISYWSQSPSDFAIKTGKLGG